MNVPSLALFAGVAVYALFAAPAWADVIYVKANATGANNGTSWANAYTHLQAPLVAAQSGDEIWVAQGTYKPTTGTDRTLSFALKSGVGLYGGFAGTETARDQRNWTTNPTTLSGDIGTTGIATDNTYHVVIGADLTVLDGFTITGGNSIGGGGGMYNRNCSPTVTNCTFSSNTTTVNGDGGGMYNWYSSPAVTNCTFSGNTAGYGGGGMFNNNSSPTVTNCTFTNNTADNGFGGGMHNLNCSPTVTNCTFSGNTAAYGGGMDNSGSSPIVRNCTFSGNTAAYGGGMHNSGSSPIVRNCTFTNNTADNGFGGGMHNWLGSPTVTNCTFSGNTAAGAYGANGGGMYSSSSSASVTNCTFSGNTADSDGGGMYNEYGSPTVTNCTFSGNRATGIHYENGYGGGMYNESSSPTVTNCAFSGNTASTSDLIVGGGGGGGMLNSGGSPTVTNCTFSGNTASLNGHGGGMYNGNSSPDVTNCIFWDNAALFGAEVYKGDGTPSFRHCDIKDSGGSGASWNPALGADGGGNMDADPRFVAPATPAGPDGLWRTRDDGLRLQSDSPCIGAADPAAAPATDILGLPRGTAPDIGAYEYWAIIPARADPAWLLFE